MPDLQNPQLTANQTSSARHDSTGAAEIFERALEVFRTGNLQTLVDLMSEDAVLEFPFAPQGRPQRIEGKDNIIKYFQAFLGSATVTGVTDVEFHRTIDPDCVIVEMTGHGTLRATGATFERRYVEVCHTKNGRIQLYREYWNPQSYPGTGNQG